MFAAKFGDLPLLVTRHADDGDGRDWVIQSPANGSGHVLQDRGLRQRRTACSILFCDEPGVGAYLDRFLAFRELARSERPRLFVHPVHGAYQAAVVDLSYSVEAQERCVRVECVFVAMEEPRAVFDVGAGVNPAAGPEAVEAYAAATDAALEEVDEASDVPTSCVSTVTEWSQAEVPEAREILADMARLQADIDDMIETTQLATDLSRWAAYRQAVNLRDAVARAASSVTAETQRISELTVSTAEPLLTICARVYGATDAEDRARQVRKLNGLRRPGLVPAGTVLKMPVVV